MLKMSLSLWLFIVYDNLLNQLKIEAKNKFEFMIIYSFDPKIEVDLLKMSFWLKEFVVLKSWWINPKLKCHKIMLKIRFNLRRFVVLRNKFKMKENL